MNPLKTGQTRQTLRHVSNCDPACKAYFGGRLPLTPDAKSSWESAKTDASKLRTRPTKQKKNVTAAEVISNRPFEVPSIAG